MRKARKYLMIPLVGLMAFQLCGCNGETVIDTAKRETYNIIDTVMGKLEGSEEGTTPKEEKQKTGKRPNLDQLPKTTIRIPARHFCDEEFDCFGYRCTNENPKSFTGITIPRVMHLWEGEWISETEYLEQEVRDYDDRCKILYTFDNEGRLISICDENNDCLLTYAPENECPGAVYKTGPVNPYENHFSITYYDAEMTVLQHDVYTRNHATAEPVAYAPSEYCISGKAEFKKVGLYGKFRDVYIYLRCEPEYDEEGKLISEKHYVHETYSDGEPYKDKGEEYIAGSIDYSYENGILKKRNSYVYDADLRLESRSYEAEEWLFDDRGYIERITLSEGFCDPETLIDVKEPVVNDLIEGNEFKDIEVLADPLLLAFEHLTYEYPILPVEFLPEVTVTAPETQNISIPSTKTDLSSLNGEIHVGDVITFGSYNLDENWENGREPLRWLVVNAENHQLRLVSENCLPSEPFNKEPVLVNWETCSLRTFLNQDFLENSFTEEEAALIQEVENRSDGMNGEAESVVVTDKIFLMDYAEFEKYLGTKKGYGAIDTPYFLRDMWNMFEDNKYPTLINGKGEIERLAPHTVTESTPLRPCMVIELPNTASTPDENGSTS